MKRKITVEVESRQQAKAIQKAFENPSFKATAIIVGTMMPFSPRAQTRMMNFLVDKINDKEST